MTNPAFYFQNNKEDVPCYVFFVYEKPPGTGGGKRDSFIASVQAEARKEIKYPINENDVELAICYATKADINNRVDVDNMLKTPLDALKNIAYIDDHQVRAVHAVLFNMNQANNVTGRVEYLKRLFFMNKDHAMMFCIYSDSRLKELGGADSVTAQRYKEWSEENPAL